MRIKIVNLNKVYPGGKKALKDLNLEIEPGMFGLLGPNGAGKTSLMRIMTLLQSCTSGTIYFDDYDIAKDRKAIRSLLGYLPQDFRFFEKLKTWEFLDYGAGLVGIKGKQHRAEVVDEMLRKVGLFEVRDRWANRLSGGMKRRLGIAQAIIGNPKVIIVDEPTTGLDPEERIRFRNILSDISDKDSIIILSTHIWQTSMMTRNTVFHKRIHSSQFQTYSCSCCSMVHFYFFTPDSPLKFITVLSQIMQHSTTITPISLTKNFRKFLCFFCCSG